jgi:putative ABC transport system permease protein
MYFVTFISRNLTRRPTRSVLTVLGLSVAVASMVALLAISDNSQRAVEESFIRRQVDLIVTQEGRSSGLNSDFREYIVDEARKIPGVGKISLAVVDTVDMTRESGAVTPVIVQGWPADNYGFEDMQIVSGRKLEDGDRRVVMLGSTLAGNLRKKVGDTIVFGSPDPDNTANVYKVIGIFHSPEIFEDGGCIVSIQDGRALTSKHVTGFSVRVKKSAPDATAEVEEVKKKIEALRDPEDPSVRLTAMSPKAFTESLTHLKMVKAMSWLVSAVGLLIGVIGMVNTMAMSVLERTQEIGILRAVGWPPGRIIRMVIGEAVLLALAASVVGIIGAAATIYLLTLTPDVNGFIQPGLAPGVVVIGLSLTVAIGVIGAIYPAFRAARLLPTEAIRHD